MTSLDLETISALLKADQNSTGGYSGARSIGPLRVKDVSKPCVRRRCTVQTNVTVNGVSFCTVHALQELNLIIMRDLLNIDTDDCTCQAGSYSNFNRHTSDCKMYEGA